MLSELFRFRNISMYSHGDKLQYLNGIIPAPSPESSSGFIKPHRLQSVPRYVNGCPSVFTTGATQDPDGISSS